MQKYLKIIGLAVGSLALAEVGNLAAGQIKNLVDNILIGQISQNGTANDTAIRLIAFLKYIHYDQAVAVFLILATAFISSLIFDKIFPGSKTRAFFILGSAWLLIVFIIPLVIGQTVNIK